MRYRLMASYRGAPYQAGVGPSSSEVTLFAAFPPPEEHGFAASAGHWRKQVRVNDIDSLWESRPVGSYHGEPCLVLDDLGDRLHIAYLGMDELRASQLGYWQVDRGVFEVVIPRNEVADLAEERHEFPLMALMAVANPLPPAAQPALGPGSPGPGAPSGPGPATSGPMAPVPAEAGGGWSEPPAGAAAWHGSPDDNEAWNGYPRQNSTGAPRPYDPASPNGSPSRSGPAASDGYAPYDSGPPNGYGSYSNPGYNGAGFNEPRYDDGDFTDAGYGNPAYDGAGYDGAGYNGAGYNGAGNNGAGHNETGYDGPGYSDPGYGNGFGGSGQSGWNAPAPDPMATRLDLDAFASPQPATPPAMPQPASAAPLSAPPLAEPQTAPSDRTVDQIDTGPLPRSATGQVPTAPAPSPPAPPAEAIQPQSALPQVPPAQAPLTQTDQVQTSQAEASRAEAGQPMADKPAADRGQGATIVRGRRAARRPRVSTQSVFAELLDLASIPRSSYAVDEEVSGAMCLIKTAGGFEVFSCADDARHEVRFFEDEEAAYFYLFGVLAAEALRSGKLAPR